MRFKYHLMFGAAVIGLAVPSTASAGGNHGDHSRPPEATELATFAATGCVGGCGSGSSVGPDGALYVTDGKAGEVVRVDPRTGVKSTFVSGLPIPLDDTGIGGAMDVTFLGHTAYVLVTLVAPSTDPPTDSVDGIYRVEKDGSTTLMASIGQWSIDHPPVADIFIPNGVQYAIETFRGGFLVTDGHHNRVLRVTRNGDISEVFQFKDIVPTGLEVSGDTVLMGEAGPVPHKPATGKVVAFRPRSPHPTRVASGASLIVDVEFGPRDQLYALSQGNWEWEDVPENVGKPASPDTGVLVKANWNGTFTPIVDGLDRPTSLEFIGDTAFVVTLTGKVMRIEHVSGRHQ